MAQIPRQSENASEKAPTGADRNADVVDQMEPTSPALAKIIKDLENRAAFRRYEGYVILSVMFSLLGIAIFVFTQAKDIASNDTSTNVSGKRAEIQKKDDSDTSTRDSLLSKMAQTTVNMPFLSAVNGRILGAEERGKAFLHLCNVSILGSDGNLRTVGSILTEWEEDTKSGCSVKENGGPAKGYETINIFPRGQGVLGVAVEFDVDKLDSVTNKNELLTTTPILSKDDIKKYSEDLQKLNHDIEIEVEAIKKLDQHETDQEIARLTNVSDEGQHVSNVNALQFLVQLNIVRFGTISLIGIAIGILSPLYRFSARLSVYYQAKADVLRLHEVKYKKTSFGGLSAALTPPLDFTKSQNVPDYLVDWLKLSASHGKTEE